jgi:hypothetical protein
MVDLIGSPAQSLQLTSHRIIQIKTDRNNTESTAVFLNQIQSISYSRKIQWGYLTAAVLFLIGCPLVGLVIDSSQGPRQHSNAAVWGFVIGLVAAILFGLLFLGSRKAIISIMPGGIEANSTPDSVNELLAFIQKVQASVVDRDLGPKAKTLV